MSAVTMSQRVEIERKNVAPSEILDLNLDGCKATEIEGISAEYTNLKNLSLVNVGLTTLIGFPALPNLLKLNLAENPITEGIEALSQCLHLERLNLSGNKLKAVDDLAPLAGIVTLKSLELNNCEIAAVENYRKELFGLLPNLVYLDGLDQNGEDEPVDEELSNGIHKTVKDIVADKNGSHAEEIGDDDVEDDEEDEDEDDVGISALQGSKELDDDEEDYVPGNEEEDVDDVDDEDEDDDDEDDVDEEVDEDDVANLSGSGVTGPRRAAKRSAGDDVDADVSDAKVKVLDGAGDRDSEIVNGDEKEEA